MKFSKDIGLFLIILVVSFGFGFGTYKYLEKNDKNKKVESINIELSYQELKEIMTKVPIEGYFNYNPYREDTKVDDISEKILIALALNKAANTTCYDESMCGENFSKSSKALNMEASKYYSINYIDKFLKEMYGYEIKQISPTSSWEDVYNSTSGVYAYEDGFFLRIGDAEVNDNIKSWELLTAYGSWGEDLVIQEYACYGDKTEFALIDYRSDKKKEINFDYFNEFHEYSNNFFIENRKEFTKYEHIFKKGEDGYYWYSTKVVED